MNKIGSYIQEAYDELLHKVNWPSWDELQQTTAIVLAALAIVTGVVSLMDGGSKLILTIIYGILAK